MSGRLQSPDFDSFDRYSVRSQPGDYLAMDQASSKQSTAAEPGAMGQRLGVVLQAPAPDRSRDAGTLHRVLGNGYAEPSGSTAWQADRRQAEQYTRQVQAQAAERQKTLGAIVVVVCYLVFAIGLLAWKAWN